MNSGLNVASGIQQGFGSVLDIATRIDAKRRTQTLARQADQRFANEMELHEESRADRALARSQNAEDREYQAGQREYQQDLQEHEKSMRPFERQIAQMQASGQYTQNQIRDAQLRGVKREEKNNEARSIIMKANEMQAGGNVQGFVEEFKKLKDYGYDVDHLVSPDKVATREFINGIVKGEQSLESPEAMEHIKRILQPSFNASGRNGEDLELTGRLTRNPQTGMFSVEMKNKKTGAVVPATLGMGSDETEDPIVTELSIQDVMDQAQAYSMLEDHAMKVVMSTANVGAGGGSLLGRGQSLDQQEQQADIEYKQAQTAKIMQEIAPEGNSNGGRGGSGYNKKRMEDMVAAYDEEDPLSKAVLLHARNMPGFDIAEAPMDVSAIRMHANANETDLAVATTAYYGAKVVAQQIPLHVAKYKAIYPGVDEKKLEQAVSDLLNNGSQGAFDKRILQLQGQAKRKKESAAKMKENAVNPNYLDRQHPSPSASYMQRQHPRANYLQQAKDRE